MEVVENRTYRTGEVVGTDRRRFVNCRFEGAQLRYGGGGHPEFVDCVFEGAGWYFDDAALRTIQLLQGLGSGPGGRAFIEDLFRPGHFIGG